MMVSAWSESMRVIAHPVVVIWLALTICLLDWKAPLGIVVWVLYMIPIWLASRIPVQGQRWTYQSAAVCAVLTATGLFVSPSSEVPLWIVMTNRAMGIGVITIIALLLARARQDEEELEHLRLKLGQGSAVTPVSQEKSNPA